MKKLLCWPLLIILCGCGGSSGSSGGPGALSPPFNSNPSPSQSPSASPTVTPTPDPPKSAIRLELNLVLPRVIDVIVSSFRLSLYAGPGNPGSLVAGPFNVTKTAGSLQRIDWTSLPIGSYLFYLELLDANGNLRGTYSTTVELRQDETLAITDPEWTDASQPGPQTNPLPPGSEPQRATTAGNFGKMVLDSARQRLYISNVSDNRVEVYDLASKALLDPIPCGNYPLGLDLSADGRYLVLCPSGQAKLQLVDLSVQPPTISDLTMPAPTTGTNRPRYIACASNGKAFFGTVFSGSGWTDLWELNLNTRQIRRRDDQATVRDPLHVRASGDRKTLALAEGNDSSGPVFVYNASTDTFGPRKVTQNSNRFAATNQDGSRFIFTGNYFDSQFRRQASTPDALADFVFTQAGRLAFGAPVNLRKMEWLDTQRNQIIRSFDLPLAPQQVLTTSDGRRFFATTSAGLEDWQLPANFPPQVESVSQLAVPLKGDGSVTLQAVDPEGDEVHFDALSLPNGAQLDSRTGVLRYRPSGGTPGTTQALISVNDGTASTTLTVPLQMLPENSASSFLPIDGDLQELYYDAASDIVFITNRSKNRVERLRLQDAAVLSPIPVLSHPQGLDRVSSGPLLVCGNTGEYMDVIDFATQAVQRSIYVPAAAGRNDRPYSVAVTASGRVLVGLDSAGTGFTIPREIDLTGDVVTQRNDLGNLSEPVQVRRSGDRTRVALSETNSSGSDAYLLDSDLANRQVLFSNVSNPVDLFGNQDGSRWLVGRAPSLYSQGNVRLGSVTPTQTFFTWRGQAGYGHNRTTALNLINLTNFSATQAFTLPTPGSGRLLLNDDQNKLVVVCEGGVALIRL